MAAGVLESNTLLPGDVEIISIRTSIVLDDGTEVIRYLRLNVRTGEITEITEEESAELTISRQCHLLVSE